MATGVPALSGAGRGGVLRGGLLKPQIDPEEVAAVILEPVQSDGGFITPPRRRRWASACGRNSFDFIAATSSTRAARPGLFATYTLRRIRLDTILLPVGCLRCSCGVRHRGTLSAPLRSRSKSQRTPGKGIAGDRRPRPRPKRHGRREPREEIARSNGLGERLADGLREPFDEVGMAGVVIYRSAAAVRKSSSRLVGLALLNRGIFAAPRDMFCISTRMDSPVIDDTFSEFADALKEVRPVVERRD